MRHEYARIGRRVPENVVTAKLPAASPRIHRFRFCMQM